MRLPVAGALLAGPRCANRASWLWWDGTCARCLAQPLSLRHAWRPTLPRMLVMILLRGADRCLCRGLRRLPRWRLSRRRPPPVRHETALLLRMLLSRLRRRLRPPLRMWLLLWLRVRLRLLQRSLLDLSWRAAEARRIATRSGAEYSSVLMVCLASFARGETQETTTVEQRREHPMSKTSFISRVSLERR